MEIKGLHTVSQPPSKELTAQGLQDVETLLETMASYLSGWLLQELTKHIPVGNDAQFGTRSHALVVKIANKSAYRAVHALLYSDALSEVIVDVM